MIAAPGSLPLSAGRRHSGTNPNPPEARQRPLHGPPPAGPHRLSGGQAADSGRGPDRPGDRRWFPRGARQGHPWRGLPLPCAVSPCAAQPPRGAGRRPRPGAGWPSPAHLHWGETGPSVARRSGCRMRFLAGPSGLQGGAADSDRGPDRQGHRQQSFRGGETGPSVAGCSRCRCRPLPGRTTPQGGWAQTPAGNGWPSQAPPLGARQGPFRQSAADAACGFSPGRAASPGGWRQTLAGGLAISGGPPGARQGHPWRGLAAAARRSSPGCAAFKGAGRKLRPGTGPAGPSPVVPTGGRDRAPCGRARPRPRAVRPGPRRVPGLAKGRAARPGTGAAGLPAAPRARRGTRRAGPAAAPRAAPAEGLGRGARPRPCPEGGAGPAAAARQGADRRHCPPGPRGLPRLH
jgi:hypothetical protein